MAERRDLLIEIGTEELPPAALRRLSESFVEGCRSRFEQYKLDPGDIEAFATPRRLGVLVHGLNDGQPDQEIVRKGPSAKAAFDAEGRPTKAALGFARSCGVEVPGLQREATSKGDWLVFRQTQRGRPTKDLVLAVVEQALAGLPIPKRMRWGDRDDEFVRPVHWVVILFGEDVVPGRLFGVDVGRETRGHRFHHPEAIVVESADDYGEALRTMGRVEPSFATRRDSVRAQVEVLAAEVGGYAVIEKELLDEVTALCEWPKAVIGGFDAEFLEVPTEVLIETMQKNQKYFPLRSADGALLPRFITISNIESLDPDQVRAGNERVIRPRFADAAFFWKQDLKTPLHGFSPRLKDVVFQEKLGSIADKAARVSQISRHIAGVLGADEELAARAAHLAKCDLVTQMIFEFGSLQGIMGRYYAERSGEDPAVCAALEEQYLPRHAGDRLPGSDIGRILSIAEKLDTLVAIFAIGQRPTGVKDPYALRRAAIGLLRILIETPLALDLKELLEFTADELREKVDASDAAGEVFGYVLERTKGYYQDLGIGADLVDSVLSIGVTVPSDADRRISAVRAFIALPEAQALAAANKRIRNILKKSGQLDERRVDPSLFQDVAEGRLAARINALRSDVRGLLGRQDYSGALELLADLRPEVDQFFDEVMVMAEDDKIRRNRLALLQELESLFLGVADISRLQPAVT